HTLDSWIRKEAHDGLDGRLAKMATAEGFTTADYRARLDGELDVIGAMGFPGYFLIVADFINWAKRNDIPVGPGRGSGAGSLVAWAPGINDLHPIRYHPLLERLHHRRAPCALRPAVRALPQPRTRVDAGLRHRLLHGPAR